MIWRIRTFVAFCQQVWFEVFKARGLCCPLCGKSWDTHYEKCAGMKRL